MNLPKATMTLLVLFMLVCTSFTSAIPQEEQLGPPPPNGDWTVNDNTQLNDTKYVVNGSLTVTTSGILELINVTLVMDGDITIEGEFYLRNTTLIMNSTNNSYGIVVEAGALMHIFDYDNDPSTNDSSLITSGIEDGNHPYTFWVKTGSDFRMENSELRECGRGDLFAVPDNNNGLFIDTDNVHFKNNTITRSRNGIIFYSSNNIISNCTFERGSYNISKPYGEFALTLVNGFKNTIRDCKFIEVLSGLTIQNSFYNTITDCTFEDNIPQIDDGRLTVGISNMDSDNNNYFNITMSMIFLGAFFVRSLKCSLDNFSIMGTYTGLASYGPNDHISFENINITEIYDPNNIDSDSSGIQFYLQNANIKISNCSISTSKLTYSHGILWTYPYTSTDFNFFNSTIDSTGIALAAHAQWLSPGGDLTDFNFENCTFISEDMSFATLYQVNNLDFTNCSFSSMGSSLYGFDSGVIAFYNNVNDVRFNNCKLDQPAGTIKLNGVVASSFFSDISIDLKFYDSTILNSSSGGILIIEDSNSISGDLFLDNCSVIDNDEVGIEVIGDNIDLEVRNSNISGNTYHGILPSDFSKSTILIENSTIANNNYAGFNVNGADETVLINIYNSTISGNGFNGITTWTSSCEFDINNTEISGNSQYGLEIDNCNVKIDNSEISDNGYSGAVLDFNNFEIINSEISYNKMMGINSEESNAIIINNNFKANLHSAISLDDALTTVVIEENSFEDNGNVGVGVNFYIYDSFLSVKNNIMTLNENISGGTGIIISGSHDSTTWIDVSENYIYGNFSTALLDLRAGVKGSVVSNELYGSGTEGFGIFSVNHDPIEIKNNLIIGPGRIGIAVANNNTILNNSISNWETGILTYYTSPTIQDNIISNNFDGIVAEVDSNPGLKNNYIQDSLNAGIRINENGSADLIDNILFSNNIGIFVDGGTLESDGNTFDGNNMGISTLDFESIHLINDTFSNNDIGFYSDSSFNVSYITNSKFENNDIALSLSNSICYLYYSTIEGSNKNFILDNGSIGFLLDSKMIGGTVEIIDIASRLEHLGYLNITVMDTSNHTISDVDVTVVNNDETGSISSSTSSSGKIERFELTVQEWTYEGTFDPNPYRVILSKPNYATTTTDLDFRHHTNLTLTLYKLNEIIEDIEAYDTPNDQGGSIELEWSIMPILNFGYYNIYVDTDYISSVDDMIPVMSIFNQSQTSATLVKMNGKYFQNIEKYYFAVTVVDTNGYEETEVLKGTNGVTPVDNIEPLPVVNLTAYDTPGDNGGSITVTWSPSTASDFDRYEIFYFTNVSLESIEAIPLSSKSIIRNIDDTTKILTGLENNIDYFILVMIYDENGNVNLTIDSFGPVRPIDNLPPLINRNASTPSIDQDLVFNTTHSQKFKIFMETNDEVTYQWFVDGELIRNETENILFLDMIDLEPGPHNVTVVVTEDSRLQDSLEWNFSLTEEIVGDGLDQASSENDLLWLMIVIIIIIFITLFFVIRQTHKYNEVRRAVRKLPKLEYNQARDILDRKRKQGDKYFLSNLIKNLPEVMKTEPDKLFNLLSMLTKDDIPEVRENAAKNLAILIDAHPEKLLVWFRSLQQLGVRTEIYKIIYRSLTNQPIKKLTETYHALLTASKEQEYKSTLEQMDVELSKSKTIKYGDELSLIYSALNTFTKYRTISSISASGSIIAGLQTHYHKAPTSLYPEVMEMFGKLGLVAETMVKYEKVEGVEDKISYLSQGINLIEDVSRFAREKLPIPEKELFLLVSTSWRNIIVFSMRELRGRAELNFRLISKEVTPELATMTLMLELENIGRGVAERTLVEVVPTNDYTILSEPQEIGRIGQKRRKEVSFEIRPRTNEPFRVEFAIRYDDSERKGKSTSFGDLVTFVEAGPDFQEIPNPYIVGTPIKAGSKLFVGRQDLIKFIQKNIKGELQENIIVLIGHRRTGKTTLLKQLPIYMPQNFIPVYIDIQGIIDPGMDAFLFLLASEITTSMNDRGIDIPEPDYEQFEKRPSYFFEHKFLKQVYEKLGDSILVMLFDEFEELEIKVDSGILDRNIFSYLRHLMQHTSQLAFIFTGTSRLENLKSDYWSIMFNIALYKRISFLSEPETTELIIEPVKDYNMVYDSLAIEKIYRLTSGHPYFTQLICHALVNLHNSDQKNYITVQDVNGEIQRIIERGQMHFDFIWDQSSLTERVVMTALMKALSEDESVTVSSLVNKLGEFGLQFTPKDISKALDMLIQKDIVTKALHRTTTYEFKIDLIRVWLESAKNLDQVVENYRTDS